MRIRLFLVCVSAGLITGGFAVQACGGTATDDTPVDAGQDVFEASVKDTSVVDAKDSALPCDPTKDFLKDIPDASLADGASTTGICLGCAKSKCAKEIANCAKDCACQGVAGEGVACYLSGEGILKCAGKFANVPAATQQLGIAVFGCLNQECSVECATSAFNLDAGDGGG